MKGGDSNGSKNTSLSSIYIGGYSFMKKFLTTLLSAALFFTCPINAFAADLPEQHNHFNGYQEIIQGSFYQRSAATATAPGKTIIHNNGNQMASDFFANGQNDGNYLVAVSYLPKNGSIIETAHFSTVPSLSTEQLSNIISDYESELATSDIPSISPMSTIKHYQWTFPDPRDGQTMASLTTAVTCDRKSSNSTIDGVACSVWDVTTFSQLEKGNAIRLNNQYTRLSVKQANQHLIAYGPSESTSGGDVSVGLDGAGVPSFSYTFNIDGFSVKNLSSMSEDYGRWGFVDNVGNETEFTTKPGIRATNSNGDFLVELSHTVDITNRFGTGVNKSTGVIQIYVSDR